MQVRNLKSSENFITEEPCYEPIPNDMEKFEAPGEFCMAISYSPVYQSVLKDLKQSTRQRFVSLEFDYPDTAIEQKNIETEALLDSDLAHQLGKFAQLTRNLKGSSLNEGASTRLLVHAGKLIKSGILPVSACTSCIAQAVNERT